MAKNKAVGLFLLLSGCASLGGGEQRPSITVAQAERNFAADAQTRTVQEAFVSAFAPDAIMFRPTPVNAQQSLAARAIPPVANLLWTPTVTETAAAGDYAISTGPSQRGERGKPPAGSGYFLSVWRANGKKWEVVFDAGTSGPLPARPPLRSQLHTPDRLIWTRTPAAASTPHHPHPSRRPRPHRSWR